MISWWDKVSDPDGPKLDPGIYSLWWFLFLFVFFFFIFWIDLMDLLNLLFWLFLLFCDGFIPFDILKCWRYEAKSSDRDDGRMATNHVPLYGKTPITICVPSPFKSGGNSCLWKILVDMLYIGLPLHTDDRDESKYSLNLYPGLYPLGF